MAKKKCFVVMGFGEKADLATGRTLDLDKTYRIIIKRAVEEAGLECIRADDVIHSGTIDKPMYQMLLEADVVVADLSTSNANAIYELGVRHALRPHTTIVLAEKQFKFPFDLGHLLIRSYEHLGQGIDAEEAERVRAELTRAIQSLVATPDIDSPVYTFLPELKAWTAAVASIAESSLAAAGETPEGQAKSSALHALFLAARSESDWEAAAKYLRRLLERRPSDDYLKQQLALATYKGEKPDAVSALGAAKAILAELTPESTTDPETLGLWGAVHKRLWEIGRGRAHLDEAIRAYEKGFYLKNDHYNGINLAFLLNVRASISASRDAIADTVVAERIRARVRAICEALLETGIRDDRGQIDKAQTFWVQASLVEALVGTRDIAGAKALRARVAAEAPEPWMAATMNEQLGKLETLLAAADGTVTL